MDLQEPPNQSAGSPSSSGAQSPKVTTSVRTAVLVVHGMGSQRALQTVRGVVDAVWMQGGKTTGLSGSPRQVWTHPEYSGVDIDLSVMTTSGMPVKNPRGEVRSVDFHELYWAHLMSETRAVAVLLWLLELVRKGPYLKPGMKALWWGASIFLCMLLASVVLLGLHAVLMLLNYPPLIDNKRQFAIFDGSLLTLLNHPYHEPEALVLAPFFVLFMVATYVAIASSIRRAFRIAVPAFVVALVTSWIYLWTGHEPIRHLTILFLPIVLSVCIAGLVMGGWGAKVMMLTYVLAGVFFGIYLHSRYMIDWDGCLFSLPQFLSPNQCVPYFSSLKPFAKVWNESWLFWSLNERYSSVIAVSVILIYCALYALFLQPYLGDAARYFRNSPGNVAVRREIRKQAVDTLDALHVSGKYDRIVVVAHSLGTVVAYDMLRAYFSRICNHLPNPATLGGLTGPVDGYNVTPDPTMAEKCTFRSSARAIVRAIAASPQAKPNAGGNQPADAKWLVTDFVSMGSPLTHAHYLMCNGDTYEALQADFERRIREREFPTCPPDRRPGDGLLLFTNPKTKKQHFHHGGLFGLTRWTNLYFPMQELFWGDAIGGPLAPVFGSYVEDVNVSTFNPPKAAFFTHTEYWSGAWPEGYRAAQIQALEAAINLEDV
jgi:hypothetical protein